MVIVLQLYISDPKGTSMLCSARVVRQFLVMALQYSRLTPR